MSQPALESPPIAAPVADAVRLPDNAYTPLAAGESYRPIVPAADPAPEVTVRSVGWGVLLCVIFTVASAYSGLKVGQVMEAGIPISILAIGLARAYRRRSTLLENIILTGIGGTAGGVVAGAIFTLPALYALKLDPNPAQTIFICLAGGCLGVLFMVQLGRLYQDRALNDRAEQLQREALAIRRRVAGEDDWVTAVSLDDLGSVLRLNGDIDDAEALLRQCLEVNRKSRGERHANTGIALHDLGLIAVARHDYGKAEALLQNGLDIHREALGEAHPLVAAGLNSLAHVWLAQKRYAEAESAMQQALAIARAALGDEHQLAAIYMAGPL